MEDPWAPSLMFQQAIPGRDRWMFNGYFDENSECKVGFTGKKVRQFPAYTGATTLGICMRNEAVASIAKQFMKALGYRGILDIDYCYDARDGLYKVLDVNPRVGSTFRLFAGKNGAEEEMDVVRALYRDLTGQPVHAATAPEGRKWLVEDFDLLACLRYRWDGVLQIRDWIGSYRGVRELGCFALDDPLPVLPMLLDDIRTLVLRAFRDRPSSRSVMAWTRCPSERSGNA
jgi:D-aspartate ligase